MQKFSLLVLTAVLALGLLFTGCARTNTLPGNGVTNNGGTTDTPADNNTAGNNGVNNNGVDNNGVNNNATEGNGTENGVTSRRVAGTTAQQIYGYVREINEQARTVTFEEVELVRSDDNTRRNQLGLGDTDFNNGLYRYNTARVSRMLPLADNLAFDMQDTVAGNLDYSSGIDYINGAIGAKRDNLYCLTVENGQVVSIRDWDNITAYDLDTMNNSYDTGVNDGMGTVNNPNVTDNLNGRRDLGYNDIY